MAKLTQQKSKHTSSYDVVPYPSWSYPQTHPDRLATVASLFGMAPTDIHHCRVLELGCADGTNVLPMAVNLPKSKFVGIDLSSVEIDRAQKFATDLKLKNIQFKTIDITTVDKKFGEFDYIIAHGLYSWVPDEVRQKIFSICHTNLAPNGVAYVSYNTYPGWHMRGMLRDMMRYHTRNLTDPKEQITQAKALVKFLADSVPTENNAFGLLLKNELDQMKKWQDAYFFHDSLEIVNDPVYFYQFVEQAQQHQLQYLGEADFYIMLASNFQQETYETLKKVGNDVIAMEQYMDFVRNRYFRQTLLCHRDIKLVRNINAAIVKQLHVLSAYRPASEHPDLFSDKPEKFTSLDGRLTITLEQPLSKIVWQRLSALYPQTIGFAELTDYANETLKVEDKAHRNNNESALANAFMRAYAKNLVQFYLYPPQLTTEISDTPVVTALTRYQAKSHRYATNQLHQQVPLTDFNRLLVQLLDGEHNHNAIHKILVDLAKQGKLTVKEGETVVTKPRQIQKAITIQLDNNLKLLAKRALLV